jgi:small nuclear ribonucleoprotein (snRNP)-like protein
VKLFIEYILDEIEQIGIKNGYRVSLSSSKNDDNYVRGVMQFFDGLFNVHLVIVFSFPEEHPNLNYVFWILDKNGNEKVVEKDGSEEKMMDTVKEAAMKEVNVNLAKGEDIRNLLREIAHHTTPTVI